MLLYEQHKYFFILFEIIHSLIVTIQKPLNCDNSSEFRVKGQTKTHDFCYTESIDHVSPGPHRSFHLV